MNDGTSFRSLSKENVKPSKYEMFKFKILLTVQVRAPNWLDDVIE